MGIALSIAVAFGAPTMVSAEEAKPAAAKAAPKKAAAANPCRKLDEAACKAAADKHCRWLPNRTVNGKEYKQICWYNPCKGLDEAACTAKADERCAWITDAVNKKGKPRKPFCRRMPLKK